MNPIIEKIARVIYEHDPDYLEDKELWAWDGLDSDTTQEHYRRIARGVIEAMGLTQQVEMVVYREPVEDLYRELPNNGCG